jgi:hypothetical protein
VKVAKSNVEAVGEFLASSDKVLVCTHATFRFAVDELGVEAFDQMLAQDAIAPGKLAATDMSKVIFVCLCYLTSPREAKHKYLLRRITALARNAKVISVAWSAGSDHEPVQSPSSAMSILPKLGQESTKSVPIDEAATLPLVAVSWTSR